MSSNVPTPTPPPPFNWKLLAKKTAIHGAISAFAVAGAGVLVWMSGNPKLMVFAPIAQMLFTAINNYLKNYDN